MKKAESKYIKKRIAFAAFLLSIFLGVLTAAFIYSVKTQLWEQSVNTILESTKQGSNTLRVQLYENDASLNVVAEQLEKVTKEETELMQQILSYFRELEDGVSLYLEGDVSLPLEVKADEEALRVVKLLNRERGIIDPHISSATGVKVFHQFVRVSLKDGTEGYLLKEYEIEKIVDSFSLSFYNHAGFSYIINTQGDVLIRPSHPNSNKTVRNLFDMLPEPPNNPDSLKKFKQALEQNQNGWAVFEYQGQNTVFCYIPLKLETDWYLISIIPESVVNAQTDQIVKSALFLIGVILLGISLLLFFYIRYADRTNRKLSNQANYIRHLYNAIPEGIALFTEECSRLLQINQEGRNLLGYPKEEEREQPDGMLIDEIVCPEDFNRLQQLFKHISTGVKKMIPEIRFRKKDGSDFWISGMIEKTLDENGRPVFILTFHDITDEKLEKEAAEREKLQERLTLVGAISNAYPVIININLTRDSLNFIYVKQGLLLDLGKQRAYTELYQDMLPTIHPDHLEDYKLRFGPKALSKMLGQEKKEVFLEARQMLADGRYHWTSTQIIYVNNPYSGDKLAILISRRVDEQKHEEEKQRQALETALANARAASDAKSQFLSNMSHDIRTPMNAIVGMTAVAGAHIEDRERVLDCLKKISLSSKHLLSLINDVLDMSKIESKKLSIKEEPFNFAEAAADVVELIRPQASEKKLKINVHLPLKNEKVIGDALRIRQVFVNILSNAVKFTPEFGSITVDVRQEDSKHRGYQNYIFCCCDTGIGMSRGFMKNLFQPFEREHDSTAGKISGTGLGMAITKNLVEMMNGDILVESDFGKGSSFTVTLPLKLQESGRDEIPEEWIGIHSLIADDDRQTCQNAAELLDELGLRPQFVTEGSAAVKCVIEANHTPDPFQLVIVDWKMPDVDGVEVTRRIRKEIGPDIPVIVLTAYDWAEIENEAKAAGVTAFLSKPFYRSKLCYLLSGLSGNQEPEKSDGYEVPMDYTGKRLLLVEDNELNREIARELIGRMGVQIEEACDGKEAVEKISASKEGYYDLILMDIQMPVMNGYEATRAIRALNRPDIKALPVIAMTANAFEEDVREALRAGMNAHVAKPVDMEALKRLLHQYLS